MAVLRARLLEAERSSQREADAAARRSLVGSASEREDPDLQLPAGPGHRPPHRASTCHNLPGVLEGDLDRLIDPLDLDRPGERLGELGTTAPASLTVATVGERLRRRRRRLREAGSATPRLDAEVLLGHVLAPDRRGCWRKPRRWWRRPAAPSRPPSSGGPPASRWPTSAASRSGTGWRSHRCARAHPAARDRDSRRARRARGGAPPERARPRRAAPHRSGRRRRDRARRDRPWRSASGAARRSSATCAHWPRTYRPRPCRSPSRMPWAMGSPTSWTSSGRPLPSRRHGPAWTCSWRTCRTSLGRDGSRACRSRRRSSRGSRSTAARMGSRSRPAARAVAGVLASEAPRCSRSAPIRPRRYGRGRRSSSPGWACSVDPDLGRRAARRVEARGRSPGGWTPT